MMIDIDFQHLVTRRLASIEPQLTKFGLKLENVAREMTKGRFQVYKATFGSEWMFEGTQPWRIRVPGLAEDFSSEDAKVNGGYLEVPL